MKNTFVNFSVFLFTILFISIILFVTAEDKPETNNSNTSVDCINNNIPADSVNINNTNENNLYVVIIPKSPKTLSKEELDDIAIELAADYEYYN